MTLQPRSESLPRTARRPPFVIPAPSRRAATRALVAAAVILVFQTVWWLPQSCDSGSVCPAFIGVITGFALVPLVLSMIVWRVAGRASAVVIVSTVIVGVTAPILPALLLGSGGNVIALLMAAVPPLLAFADTGALPDLRPYLTERTFTIVVLVLVGAVLVSQSVTYLTITAAVVMVAVSVAVAAGIFERRAVAVAALPDEE
ncbi:MAG TPA: hypothetical protein VKA85_05940 [Candidatus Limnocylindrales bacterium]|nr:hypothetical protein [Candidatus Limnocylindrales bacterium]